MICPVCQEILSRIRSESRFTVDGRGEDRNPFDPTDRIEIAIPDNNGMTKKKV
jgi:hypothetical protein